MSKLARDIVALKALCLESIEKDICQDAWYHLLEFGYITNQLLQRVLYLAKKYNLELYIK